MAVIMNHMIFGIGLEKILGKQLEMLEKLFVVLRRGVSVIHSIDQLYQ